MKNLKLFIFSMITFLLYTVGVQAQTATQTITRGDIKNYAVDLDGGATPNGTEGSTYTWTVFNTETPAVDITTSGTLTIANQATSTSGNAITIDWGTTPTGTYTLKVQESTISCVGEEKLITVVINPRITLEAPLGEICSNGEAVFTITDAEPGSTVIFTITGGTSVVTSPVTIGTDGTAVIPVIPTAGSTEIVVTLDSMEINGVVTPIDPAIRQVVDVTVITTSEIEFD